MTIKTDAELKALFATGIYPPAASFAAFVDSKASAAGNVMSATSTTQTLSASSQRLYVLSPSANHDVVLDNSFPAGIPIRILNLSATKVLTLKAASGTICIILPKGWLDVLPLVASPATNTDWIQVDAGGDWVDWGGTAGANFGAGFGTVSALSTNQIMGCRRAGDLKLKGRFVVGTVTTGAGLILIPWSLTIDTDKVETNVARFGLYNVAEPSETYPAIWATNNKSGVFFYRAAAGSQYIEIASHSGSNIFTDDNVGSIMAAGATVIFSDLTIPISGWKLL